MQAYRGMASEGLWRIRLAFNPARRFLILPHRDRCEPAPKFMIQLSSICSDERACDGSANTRDPQPTPHTHLSRRRHSVGGLYACPSLIIVKWFTTNQSRINTMPENGLGHKVVHRFVESLVPQTSALRRVCCCAVPIPGLHIA